MVKNSSLPRNLRIDFALIRFGGMNLTARIYTMVNQKGGVGKTTTAINLGAYLARGEARPAYQRAFDAQLALYTGKN